MDSQSIDEPSESGNSREPLSSATTSPARGSARIAWLVIFIAMAFVISPHSLGRREKSSEPSNVLFEIQAKYLVGSASLGIMPYEVQRKQIQEVFGNGSLPKQFIGTVLIGELVGPEAGIRSLDELDRQIARGDLSATDLDNQIGILLRKIFQARIENHPIESRLTKTEIDACRTLLPEHLGWAGRLALYPPGSSDREERTKLLNQARQTMFVILGVFGFGATATVCGLILQIVWWIFVAAGRISSGINPIRGSGAIYAETFAVWLVLFLCLSVVLSFLPLAKLGLVTVLIPQIGSLSALAWPVMRGLRWSDVCEDIGLKFGPRGWTAPFVAIAAYLSALPVLVVAMLVTLIMMLIASQFVAPNDAVAAPMHPIVEQIFHGDWMIRLQLLLVAVFAAVPEEIMFRGVLYRHLRESASKRGLIPSVIFAALISSFIFAAVHPQGLFGIPVLMSLAIVFAIVREWRGSLVPCIIAHAIVNAGTSLVLLLIAD